ncbi:hypothetical protein [Candidatus Halobonum tyrrellensis]|uniref:Type I restriction enzyme R protein N-terminal domain-containing protein n=1 Tax=Candidatus Halobonum tyrrellensis G22 TaxID=1324957 RepID=V4HQF5_9EURY|nr:hypothetical protein [Candidatus Halobonum tyrrellensis]ESP90149.1 hypothetical protein K933_01272 [Candidatus Halobonum tyrrellensis G22]
MDSAIVDGAVSDLRAVVEDFLDELADRNLSADRLGEIIEADAEFEGADLRQFPERFVEDHLIWPVLDVLGYAVTPRPDSPGQSREEYPDFRVDNLPAMVIGENKSVNDIETSKTELLDYLDNTRYEYGIATDGFQWGVYEIAETDGRSLALEPIVEPQSLKQVVQYVAREGRMVPYADLNGLPELDGLLATFFQNLGHHHVRRATGGLSDFHDLYAETIIGEGDYNHNGIDTPLAEAVDAPAGTGEAEKTAFAALLLDRLTFVRLMRDRGVLKVKLHEEWSHHNKGLNRFQGSFYDTHLKPLFYDVLSEPKGEREEDKFGNPPHFAGGLFEPVLHDEGAYDVSDDVMQDVLTVFIEGESRTVINEGARGSLLESYRATEEPDLAGRMAEWYADLTRVYETELAYVEENISPTLRRHSIGAIDD